MTGEGDDAFLAHWNFEPTVGQPKNFGFAPLAQRPSGGLILASEALSWWRGIVFFVILGLVPAGFVHATLRALGSGWARPIGFGIGVVLALGVWGILLLFLAAFGGMSPALAGSIALLEGVFLIIAGALSAFRKTQLPD